MPPIIYLSVALFAIVGSTLRAQSTNLSASPSHEAATAQEKSAAPVQTNSSSETSPTPKKQGIHPDDIGSGFLANPSFEVPVIPSPATFYSFITLPTNAGWTFLNGAGIAKNGAAFNGDQPMGTTNGTQYAFLQGLHGVGAAISQTISNMPAGSYSVTFSAAQREQPGAVNTENQTAIVLIDGTCVGTFTPPPQVWYPYFTEPVPLTAGNHTLTLSNVPALGDAVLLLDNIGVKSVPPAEKDSIIQKLESLKEGLVEARALTMTTKEAASNPLKKSANVRSSHDSLKPRFDFLNRQFVDGYNLRGERNPNSDALSLGFLHNWVAAYNFATYYGTFDTNLPPLPQLATQLANDPDCTDPIVLTIAGQIEPDSFEATRRLNRALAGFEHSKHRAFPKFLAIVTLEQKLPDAQKNLIPALDVQALAFLRESFADGSITPEDQEELGSEITEKWGKDFFVRNGDAVTQIIEAQGKLYEWLALTAKGVSEVNEAWRARGSDWANKVTDQGWKSFGEHLAVARKYLTRAWMLRPDLPLAPAHMMAVALGESGIGEIRLWFDRTMAAQMDYLPAWDSMRWCLRPRWCGDIDSMFAFGMMALKTKRFDTDVPRIYFYTLMDVEDELGLAKSQHIYGRPEIWPHIQELYDGYIGEPKMSESVRVCWRNGYVKVAYISGKYDVARKQLEALHWQLNPSDQSTWGVDLSHMMEEVAARTGTDDKAVNAAEALREKGDISGAFEAYKTLSTSTNSDAMTRSFVQVRLNTLSPAQTSPQK